VLNGKKTGSFIGTDHKWKVSFSRWGASILTTKIDKVGSSLVSPVSVINPVSLLVSSFTLVVMVHKVSKPKLLEVVVVNIWKSVGID
jgi:hypothetical protein